MRKLVTVLLAALCVNFAFAQVKTKIKASSATSAKEERNKKIAMDIFNAYQNGNIDDAFKNYDQHIMFTSSGLAEARTVAIDTFSKNAGEEFKRWTNSFPDAKQNLIAAAADGDYVLVYFNEGGTWKNNMEFWKASNKSYKMNDVMVLKFNDAGKVVEQQNLMPQYALMSQLADGAEFELNRIGYVLLGQQKVNDAIEVFKLNVQLYPESSNTYDSLGEAYAAAGNKQLAIENYEKSVQMDPGNENGKNMLVKLRQQ